MSQTSVNGNNLMDPFGFWKTTRDANLEAWSKLMIDIVNSNEYAQATGMALEQVLETSQPLRDAVEKSMTQTLSLLNMPSRAEVISIAERLVNVEMRLDDLDAKLGSIRKSLEGTINTSLRETTLPFATQSDQLKNIEAKLAELSTNLSALHTAIAPAAQPAVSAKAEPKAEAKPQTKGPAQARQTPSSGNEGLPVKTQEAK